MPNSAVVDAVIEAINDLKPDERQELTVRVRTTPEGIKAYTAFNFGLFHDAEEAGEPEPEPSPS